MKNINVNKILVLDMCRCKYLNQVHLITLITRHSKSRRRIKERHNTKSRYTVSVYSLK